MTDDEMAERRENFIERGVAHVQYVYTLSGTAFANEPPWPELGQARDGDWVIAPDGRQWYKANGGWQLVIVASVPGPPGPAGSPGPPGPPGPNTPIPGMVMLLSSSPIPTGWVDVTLLVGMPLRNLLNASGVRLIQQVQ